MASTRTRDAALQKCARPFARTRSSPGTALSTTAMFFHACPRPVAFVSRGSSRSPEIDTTKHLAGRILTFNTALECEHTQVTVLFADLTGSMELLAVRDPEEVRPVKQTMKAESLAELATMAARQGAAAQPKR